MNNEKWNHSKLNIGTFHTLNGVIMEDSISNTSDSYVEELLRSHHQLSSIFNNIDVGLLLQGPNAEIWLSNDLAFEMLGLTPDQLLGKTSYDSSWNVIREDGSQFPSEAHPVPEAIKTKNPVREVIMGVYRPKNRDRIWLLVSAVPILNEDSSIKHVVCSFIDISKRKAVEESLEKNHKKLSILYEVYQKTTLNLSMKDLLINALNILKEAFSIDGILIYLINTASQKLSSEASIGFSGELLQNLQDIKMEEGIAGRAIFTKTPQFTNYKDYPEGRLKVLFLRENFKSMASIPMIIGDKALGTINIAFTKEKFFDQEEIQLLMAVGRQIGIAIENAQLIDSLKYELIERKNIEEKMRKANETIQQKNSQLSEMMKTLELETKIDVLTGLYNRRHILKKINEQVSNFRLNKNLFSIIIGDIDFFKKVNDTFGHAFGDYVLKTVSDILRSSLNEQDCVARWGGEEFLILLVNSNLQQSTAAAEKIRKKIMEKTFEFDSEKLSLTMTFGVAEYKENESIDTMIKKADDALYIGKNNGRNRVISS